MKLINEIAHDMVVEEMLAEFDAVLDRYSKLVMKTSLNEGTMDNISDDVIQMVAVLENRITTTKAARDHVAKLVSEKLTVENKDHRQDVTGKKDYIIAALKRTMTEMDKFERIASRGFSTDNEDLVEDSSPEETDAQPSEQTPLDAMLDLDA